MSYFENSLRVGYQTEESGLSLPEQLYTARGSQGAAIPSTMVDFMLTDPSSYDSIFLRETFGNTTRWAFPTRPLWTFKSFPMYTNFPTNNEVSLTSVPMITFMANCTMDELLM